MSLLENIHRNVALRDQNEGCSHVVIVTGSERDRAYWQDAFRESRHDVFRADGQVSIESIAEEGRKGNFLGALAAWRRTAHPDRSLVLMNMVFGKGKRLSPFTQSLGDRKPAFPTPRFGRGAARFLTSAEVAALYSNAFGDLLRSCGFSGALLKWGDEILVPSRDPWLDADALRDCDAVRFTSETTISDDLASQKEWLVYDRSSRLLEAELSRQPSGSLHARLASYDRATIGVNLGSLAISDVMLEEAVQAFQPVISDAATWIDWDPYVWMALLCDSSDAWERERRLEEERGARGIADLERRVPDLFARCFAWRRSVEKRVGRPLRIVTIDFGAPMWVDFGLHRPLYSVFDGLRGDSEHSHALRELFDIPHQRDRDDNIIVDSDLPAGCRVRGSVILRSRVTDPASVIDNSTIIATTAGHIRAATGAVCVESRGAEIVIDGPDAISFRSLGPAIRVAPGERHTTILIDGRPVDLSLAPTLDPDRIYSERSASNRLSFEEASLVMQRCEWNDYEMRREELASELLAAATRFTPSSSRPRSG